MAAEARLIVERKAWRKDRPENFVAKPRQRSDKSTDLFQWDVVIPGKPGSVWAPGLYPATMTFTQDYPEKPPTVKFLPINGKPLFHPNVYNDGGVCMSIINPEGSRHHYGSGGTWKPSLTIKQVLLALQTFLDEATSLCVAAAATRKHPSAHPHECSRGTPMLALRTGLRAVVPQGGGSRGGLPFVQQRPSRV